MDSTVVDVVVVSYNSRATLRRCVAPLAGRAGISVFVVDNASPEPATDVVSDLPVATIELPANRGFAYGCNVGARAGRSPYVLFLNPDAVISASTLHGLVSLLADDATVGIVAPKVVQPDGELEFSQRRFPRLRSTYARALFLHRVAPTLEWADELIRSPHAYESVAQPDWVSGACLLIRRAVLDEVGGWDERFFMYCEDIDLCARVRARGYEVRFDPSATVQHVGGASAPRPALIPTLAASRMLYAQKHRSPAGAFAERVGLALEALTHAALTSRGRAARAGHARALGVLSGLVQHA